ncbi:MAG: PDZ domain-containing protein [Parachlamydiales bacterium]|nr:PDZ domain-containing protein [Parachlamydiales bacterium]
MRKNITALFIGFTLFFLSLEAKNQPQLQNKDVTEIAHDILAAHASNHELNDTIVKRILINYIEYLDPTKTYFIEEDISQWLNPSNEVLNQVIEGFPKGNFTTFSEIDQKMQTAIQRRRIFENRLQEQELTADVNPLEFKDMKWTVNEDDLYLRLFRLRCAQITAAQKFSDDSREKFIQRITKKRLKTEEEFISNSESDRKQSSYNYILKSLASALDTHTVYFTPGEASQFTIMVQQRLFGIGVQIRDDLSGFTIMRILEGGPAAEGKLLKVNDRIIAINNETIVGLDIEEFVEILRGPEGTLVHLTILRSVTEGDVVVDHKIDIPIVRKEVVLTETRYETTIEPFADGIIAHLKLYSFYQDANNSSAADLREEINKLKKEYKVKGVILDLRQNSGGLLAQGVGVSGLFISKGIVASIKDCNGSVQHLRQFDNNPAWEGPLIVLISKASASAAEIVAQSLQDYGRAIVIGDEHSFGKGTFQTFTLDTSHNFSINPRGEYKVTRGRYYTVSGKSPQLTGVTSDVVVPGPYAFADIGESFSKFPLENDAIEPHFEDTLDDLAFTKRKQISWLYKLNQQPIITQYNQHLTQLRLNSKKRIEQNTSYQTFLTAIQKKGEEIDEEEVLISIDHQYVESVNIIKDLIVLNN